MILGFACIDPVVWPSAINMLCAPDNTAEKHDQMDEAPGASILPVYLIRLRVQ